MLDNLSYNCFKSGNFKISIKEMKKKKVQEIICEKSVPFMGLSGLKDNKSSINYF